MAILEQSSEIATFPTVAVPGEVFNAHPDAVFWIGKIATLETKGIDSISYMDAMGKFRGNVYVHEREYLSKDTLDEMGREFDEYDQRSEHFIITENGNEDKSPRMVGSIRLITKSDPSQLYPIEKYFPELFEEAIPTNTAEVSRFIARYPEDKRLMQNVISLSLIRAATLYGVRENIEHYYCIIEKPLLRSLKGIGIPLEELGPAKYVEEENGTLYPIRINGKTIINSVTTDRTGNIILEDFFSKEIGSGGEGYYPATMVGGDYE